ncbi:MAG: hypothetical protein R3C49_03760 [Planctomycetaceae bacterium]
MISRWAENQSLMARRFFLATIAQAVVCLVLTWLLKTIFPAPPPSLRIRLPNAFVFSTGFLIIGSWSLHIAWQAVRREQQDRFRRHLKLSLAFAVLFVAVQSFGLLGFVRGTHDAFNPQTNAHGFVFVFVALHAMHFLIAQSALLWIAIAAHYDRYDHEYYFGVTFAMWFWHALGIVWLGILCVFLIAA